MLSDAALGRFDCYLTYLEDHPTRQDLLDHLRYIHRPGVDPELKRGDSIEKSTILVNLECQIPIFLPFSSIY